MNTKDVYVLTQEIADMVKGSLDNWENDDTRGTLLTRDHFATEEEAKKNGYYWHETFNRWMPQS